MATMVLCFGFVLKAVLIIQGCLSLAEQCLHSTQVFSASHAAPSASRLGVHKKLG